VRRLTLPVNRAAADLKRIQLVGASVIFSLVWITDASLKGSPIRLANIIWITLLHAFVGAITQCLLRCSRCRSRTRTTTAVCLLRSATTARHEAPCARSLQRFCQRRQLYPKRLDQALVAFGRLYSFLAKARCRFTRSFLHFSSRQHYSRCLTIFRMSLPMSWKR
jgi:hypothetical protein